MPRVHVFHWNSEEAQPLLANLRAAGYKVDYSEKTDPRVFKTIRESTPEAVVIDLSRLPSHGREVATALRGTKATRSIPIIFVGGASEKVAVVREKLPDAVFTTQSKLAADLRLALDSPPANPIVPKQMMDRYATRTPAQKLGIKEGTALALIDPPSDYMRVLDPLPEQVSVLENPDGPCPVTLWFVRELGAYLADLPRIGNWADRTKLWILWPKQAGSAKPSPITQALIRESALEIGLVDYKICSVNASWSGLLFTRKKIV